jgi:hypothetical protein
MTTINDFAIISDFEIVKNDTETDDKYEITEIIELIRNGNVSIQKNGAELSLIDTTRGNITIGILHNLRFR